MTPLDPIFRTETALLLAERPGDEVAHWGGVIAALCRAGRPPFVVVLTDGPTPDPAADHQVGAALAGLGLDGGRLLMFGIAGELPGAGAVFDAAVQAVCFVAWRQDCNVLGMPGGAGPGVRALAEAAVGRSGLGLVAGEPGRTRLLAAPRRSAQGADLSGAPAG